MPSLITPRELPKWVPGKVLAASDALGWKDVGQPTYRYVGQDVAVPGMDHFTIVRYCAGGTRMERRFDGRRTRTHCAPGDLSPLTQSQGSHWHRTEDIDVSHVYLSEALVSRVASDVMERSVAAVQLHLLSQGDLAVKECLTFPNFDGADPEGVPLGYASPSRRAPSAPLPTRLRRRP
jgi:AraC family transcriptional regulator